MLKDQGSKREIISEKYLMISYNEGLSIIRSCYKKMLQTFVEMLFSTKDVRV